MLLAKTCRAIERWLTGRLTSQDVCCRQIKDTPVPELHDAYAGRLSRIESGDRELVDIKVLCSVSGVSRQPEIAGWKAD